MQQNTAQQSPHSNFSIERDIAHRLKERSGAKEVWLFGSRATGRANENSDYVFMLVFDDAVDVSEADRQVDEVVIDLCHELKEGVDAVTILERAFHFPIENLHPASVSYACRTEGVRLI